MAEKETTLKEVGEMLAHVVEHMATKEDIADIRREMATKDDLNSFRQEFRDFRDETRQNFREIRAELADIRRDVEELKSRADNSAGYSKEIDHALARIAAIEKHLGIERKIAA
jgi:methyl-accepting chemotaxis protein